MASYPNESVLWAKCNACMISLTYPGCVHFVIWPGYVVKSFRHLSVLNVFCIVYMSDFVVLKIMTLQPLFFYFENWWDELCGSVVWLPVWLDLLCAYGCGWSPLLSKIDLVCVLHRAEWRAASGPLLKCAVVQAAGNTSIIKNGLNQLWLLCQSSGNLDVTVASPHYSVHQLSWKGILFSPLTVITVTATVKLR